MSFDAASSEKVPQMPTPNRYDPNQSSIQELPSNAHPSSEEKHPLLSHTIPPALAPFISVFLFGSIGIVSDQRLDDLIAKGNDKEWSDFRNAVVTRVNNLNVVASLFITYAPMPQFKMWIPTDYIPL
ncbi:hypothetical protein FRB95_010589 [Tulasnella sp. JGI-2019a]|nr:hypothetical protein FRB95_010589 [Tulasnella sp. JGI-2019a]